jgi:mono/diheme cytochrome c family protein
MNRILFLSCLTALSASSFVIADSAALTVNRGGGPTGCEDITSVPPFTQFSYTRNIQSIFDVNCQQCHQNGGSAGGINLDVANSYNNLLIAVGPNPALVIPKNPSASVLFLKVNCDSPGAGTRMPQGADPLSLAQQAILFDWIRLGAPLVRSGFEDR